MFTGLVEEQGSIADIQDNGPNAKTISIQCTTVSDEVEVGASVAINGCCLTVVKIADRILEFQAGSETLGRTNLGELEIGTKVNLERAIRAGDRLGGHYVSGHIDCVAKVIDRTDDQDWSGFWFELPEQWTRQMACKGSVAVDGVSLTLVDVEMDKFSVALIPHTLNATSLGGRCVGDIVNIETDILAKYVQQQLARQKD